MSDTTIATVNVAPAAIVSEAELAAWNALPRDEQVRRYRAVFADAACRQVTNDSLEDILAAARQRVAERRG
jgi:hypothetical protein